jgi:hypothetical protein
VPGFEGETPIPVIPVLARAPNADLVGEASGSSGVSSSRTRDGKHTVASSQALPAKVRKATSKKATGIKINEPMPQMHSAPTALGNTQGSPEIQVVPGRHGPGPTRPGPY